MKISFKWLKQFVDLPDSTTAQEVADKLKMSTVEVEGVEVQGKSLEDVVVGEILEIRPHKNADKLSVAKVDVGNGETRQVIFGQMAKIEIGDKVPVAKAPTTLPGNKEIKKGEIRGELSEGMLCLDQELGILNEGVSITYFDKHVKNGTPITEAMGLNDAILEIDNKSLSNRPDLWGHYGIAREVAALFNREVKPFKTKTILAGKEIKISFKAEDEKFCSTAMFVAVSGVTVGSSPLWLQQKLMAVGQRPINNVVDITNYIMFEMGKPMHAFDAKTLQNKKGGVDVVVRPAKEGEELILIGGKKLILNPSYQIVGNKETALSLAGIMGGENSGVNNDTTTVVFETAIFDASSIRKASTALGIRTDSSARFEKSLDSALCLSSLERAVELILECCPGAKVASSVVGIGGKKFYSPKIEIPVEFFAQKIGVEIPAKTIVNILTRLGFGVVEKKKELIVTVPSWRATKDISIAEDVVEEVLRMYGYENVPSTMPIFAITPPVANTLRNLEHAVASTMVRDLAYTEVYNYSFVSPEQIAKLGDDVAKYLELDNPVSKEKPFLRRCLLANLLENLDKNLPYRDELNFFEIGKVFRNEQGGMRTHETSDELLPGQDTWFTSVACNKKSTEQFFAARSVAEIIANNLGLNLIYSAPAENRLGRHPTRAADLLIGDKLVGYVYELSPAVSEAFGIAGRVGVVKLNLSLIAEVGLNDKKKYQPISVFPGAMRDIAFVVNKNKTHAEIVEVLKNIDALVKNVELFDVYAGKNMAEGKKSMAYRLTFESSERTLKTEEVDAIMKKVEVILKEKFGAEVR